MSDDLVKSHIEWLRGDHEGCNPFLADRIETLVAERDALRDREKHFASVLSVADRGQYRNDWDAAIRRVVAERDALREALKVTSAILQAEMYRSGGEPFSGTWRIPALQIRATCHEALDQANAALNREPDT